MVIHIFLAKINPKKFLDESNILVELFNEYFEQKDKIIEKWRIKLTIDYFLYKEWFYKINKKCKKYFLN